MPRKSTSSASITSEPVVTDELVAEETMTEETMNEEITNEEPMNEEIMNEEITSEEPMNEEEPKPTQIVTQEQWLKNREYDVSQFVKKKQGLDYISWATMEYLIWKLLGYMPEHQYDVQLDKGIISCQFEGYQSYSLAITDFRNKYVPNPDPTQIENTKQRVFVKAATRSFGIAHGVYEGLGGFVPQDGDLMLQEEDNPRLTPTQIAELNKLYKTYTDTQESPDKAKETFLAFLKAHNIPAAKSEILQSDFSLVVDWLRGQLPNLPF